MFGAFRKTEDRVMSSRTHLGLRIGGLVVLVVLALLPRSRAAHSDPAITVSAFRAHEAHSLELVSAKPAASLSDAKPRSRASRAPRAPRADGDIVANVDESALTN